jgi:GNAT superfamily N-acetyltransferase
VHEPADVCTTGPLPNSLSPGAPARDPRRMPPADLAIEPVDPHDRAAVDGWFALQVRAHGHDDPDLPPCPVCHVHRFAWPGVRQRAWVVRAGPDTVGAATLALPEHDDPDHGFLHVLVAPSHRRRGLGTRLVRHAAAHARDAGRARLFCGAADPPGTSSAFLRTVGGRLGMRETRRRLVLPPRDPQVLRDLATTAGGAARHYRLVQWTGPTPADRRDDLAVLIGRMSTDAPMGELAVPPRRWDADRVRERDDARGANGVRAFVTAAQAADGRLVAYTEIVACAAEPDVAEQSDTLVAPGHRGHRLGLRMKLANLDQLLREHPDVRAVDTFNADDNRWMIAVNEAMGFVPIQRIEDYELDLTTGQTGTTAAISSAALGP